MNSKIKVCHITSVHKSNDIRIFLKECSTLAANGFDVTLIAVNGQTETRNNVTIIGVPCEYGGRLSRMRKAAKAAYQAALKVDATVYHFHDPEILPYGLKLKKAGKIVIYDAHEDVPRQILSKFWINKYLRKFISRSFERFENRVAKKLSGIVTATPFIAQRFAKINPNTIDINNFPLDDELASMSPWDKKKNQVCYIGGLSRIRGNEQMVDALEKLESTKLIVAGPFSDVNFETELKGKKGWLKVDYKGIVDRKGVASIMEESKAGLVTFLPLPNHVDAQPNKMFEYMSAGIPVIASHFPLWKQIIEGNHCGICVDPENPEQIAQAMEYLCNNDTEAKKMGENGKRAIDSTYNWTAESKKLIAFYHRLLLAK